MRKQMPKSEARPLGTKAGKKGKTGGAAPAAPESLSQSESGSTAGTGEKEIVGAADNRGSASVSNVVNFPKSETVNPVTGEKKMEITLTRSTKETKSKAIRFVSDLIRGVIRIPSTAFVVVPDTIVINVPDGALAVASGKVAKAKLSPEERKAAAAVEKARRLALTPEARQAEDNAKVEARRAKLAKQLAATEAKLAK